MSEINNQQPVAKNPLSNWFRQPKIYVKLPSQGRFYPPNTLDVSSNDEYPVFAMTAKDELMFKTPDALLSGQSTVEIIKSCIPAIKEPWQMPSIDVDFALIAIRIATYGENITYGLQKVLGTMLLKKGILRSGGRKLKQIKTSDITLL